MKRKPIPKQEKARMKRLTVFAIILGLIMSIIFFLAYKSILYSLISLVLTIILFAVYIYFKRKLKETARIRQIETVFPDFLQLMSSNLRAGMIIDKAMLLSSRPEFAPLDAEILQAGKDITTGKSIELALIDMSKRINSPKIEKTILLINSGIRAGGDLAVLLEDTSSNMREKEMLDKKASSNVLMYVIFIFLAVSFFAPALFSLSTVLVEILTNIFSGLPEVSSTTVSLPFTLSKINISITFIKFFSVIFIIVIDVLACLVLGLVNKGEEKQGLRYLPAILIISLSVFFIARSLIMNFMSGLF
ncbi:MAG: type II secretion system F family protein [Candidatus Pacearchaeota archaeon]